MNQIIKLTSLLAAVVSLISCDNSDLGGTDSHADADAHQQAEAMTGPNGGRLLVDGAFAVELAIFEAGVPPEFRAWVTESGESAALGGVVLSATLTRLGNAVDEISFVSAGDLLKGDAIVYEPHSFIVDVDAEYQGNKYHWEYESVEGRTHIGAEIAAATGIETEVAGPATIRDLVTVYGQIVSNPESVSHVTARFAGVIREVHASIGDEVTAGQRLAVVEANDSLTSYVINAPISGTIIERHANNGETTDGRTLFTIVDPTSVWAELAVFPTDRPRIRVGAPVSVKTAVGDVRINGEIAVLSPVAGNNQSVTARVRLDNLEGLLAAGMYLTGEIAVAEYDVPLAVRRVGLQAFRDFTVVYQQIGDDYEVRMLELGRQDSEWVEILGGLDEGARYVTTNSYVIKADIEKSGAAHDH